jgi:hypothetical protein
MKKKITNSDFFNENSGIEKKNEKKNSFIHSNSCEILE